MVEPGRVSRQDGEVERFCYLVCYVLCTFSADTPVHVDSADFCVMTRRAVTLLLALPEKLRFVRGLRAWLGLPARPFPISRAARAAGQPQYSIWQLVKLASAGLTSFSTKPLRIGLICGALLCVLP